MQSNWSANHIVARWSNRLLPAQPETSATLDRIAAPYMLLKSNPKAAQKIGAWMAFDMPFAINGRASTLPSCDFASAGSEWREGNYYRTWLPQPLDLGRG